MPGTDHRQPQEPDTVAGRGPDLPARPEKPALDQLFDADSLYALRSAVAAHGSDLGLTEQALSDLVLVAHELATNAVRHGGVTAASPGRLCLWPGDGVVVCQVHDPGPGPSDASSAGTTPAPPSANNGRGLWIIRTLARRLDISSGADGTTVTATLPIG